MKWLLLCLFVGCASTNPYTGPSVQLGTDLLQCAQDEYSKVKDAWTNGGSDWLSVVAELLHCVPSVYTDIKSLVNPPKVAGDVPVLILSKGAKRRIRVSLILAGVANASARTH